MLVVGRLGGPLAAPTMLLFETVRFILGGIEGGARPSASAFSDAMGGVALGGKLDPELWRVGGAPEGPVLFPGGRPAPLAALGGPDRGGGGVAAFATLSSAPPFLLIHRLSSGS